MKITRFAGRDFRARYVVGLVVLVAVFMIGCVGSSGNSSDSATTKSSTATNRGNEIIAEYLKRDAAPYRKDRVRFTVKSTNDPDEIFELDVWRRQTALQTETTSIITKPVEDAGSGSLAIETPDRPTVNVTYSASRDEFRESDTSKLFFGGLTAQELLGEWSKYDYTLIGEIETAGMQAFEVEGVLKAGQKSTIARNKVVFDSQNYLLLEVHIFDNSGKELRTYKQKEIRTLNGRPYVAKTEVENHIYKSTTTIDIASREYPATLDDSIFSREKLKQSAQK